VGQGFLESNHLDLLDLSRDPKKAAMLKG